MTAEVIVVHGEGSGARHVLGSGEAQIGRAPSSILVLNEPQAAWRHCSLHYQDGRYLLTDLRSGSGTYVNGMKVSEHLLEDGDQIGIGNTVLLFRQRVESLEHEAVRPTLLRASALLFLFRTLGTAQEGPQQDLLKTQIVRLLSDLLPCDAGAIAIGKDQEELLDCVRESASSMRGCHAAALEELVRRTIAEGTAADSASGCMAAPLYVHGSLAGVIALHFPGLQASELGGHRETLAAIVTLASTALETVHEVESLRFANSLLEERLGSSKTGIVGESPSIQRLLAMIERVAPQETTVLILGESGTGKELVARALHQRSPRREKPFVAINCAALTESLLESELFGHEKGAFTGAIAQKKGRLEMAEGGAVFLDEIGEMAAPLQAKLLRVLQQREFERVGGAKTMKLDIRLIAATNRDLSDEVKRGAFREDLYHRLNVVTLRTPPLRERREDIPLLARHFLKPISERCRRRVTGLSPEAERLLTLYHWPGNVRELENAIERAVVLGSGEVVLPEDLPETILEATPPAEPDAAAYQHTVSGAKRESIIKAWEQTGGQYKEAARVLGLHPNSLLRLIRNLGLRELLK